MKEPKWGRRWTIEREDGNYCSCFIVRVPDDKAMVRINAMNPEGYVSTYLRLYDFDFAENAADSFKEIIGHDGKNPCDWHNFKNWN